MHLLLIRLVHFFARFTRLWLHLARTFVLPFSCTFCVLSSYLGSPFTISTSFAHLFRGFVRTFHVPSAYSSRTFLRTFYEPLSAPCAYLCFYLVCTFCALSSYPTHNFCELIALCLVLYASLCTFGTLCASFTYRFHNFCSSLLHFYRTLRSLCALLFAAFVHLRCILSLSYRLATVRSFLAVFWKPFVHLSRT